MDEKEPREDVLICKIDLLFNSKYKITLSSLPLMSSFAYVWCVFGGNFYVPGALVSAFSVKKTGTSFDLICLYTEDVTELKEHGENIFTKLIKVPYIQFKTKQMRTEKQREIYGSWIDKSFTKMNCMMLTEYKRVLFLDSDTLVLKNIDHLFQLPSPAGTFSSAWGKPYGASIPLHMYPTEHGKTVTPKMIDEALRVSGVVVIGTTLLLEPSESDFNEYKNYVQSNEPYGFKCNSGFDEQSISCFYSRIKKKNWTHIHQVYNFIPWKTGWKKESEEAFVLHYFNKEKPWILDPKKYPDLEVFYKYFDQMKSLTLDGVTS